jgi:hypothetical protein
MLQLSILKVQYSESQNLKLQSCKIKFPGNVIFIKVKERSKYCPHKNICFAILKKAKKSDKIIHTHICMHV